MHIENEHYLVCNYDETLFSKLSGKAIVVKTDDLHLINKINDVVNHHNKLHCIQLNVNSKLAGVQIKEEWTDIPIHLFVPEFGAFKDVVPKFALIRKLNMRVFLSSDYPENYTNLQILASLGIDCGIYFGNNKIDWDQLNDLMHFAIYGKARKASIEPFNYIVTRYNPQQYVDFDTVYFENPLRYLHFGDNCQLAITNKDILKGEFVDVDLNKIESIVEHPKYQEKLTYWNSFFLKQDGCAYCPGYRICLGKFESQIDEKKSCTEFFEDMLDACDFFASKNTNIKTKELCQL